MPTPHSKGAVGAAVDDDDDDGYLGVKGKNKWNGRSFNDGLAKISTSKVKKAYF